LELRLHLADYRPSIRTVLIGGMTLVIVGLMAVTTFVDVRRQERTERGDLQQRGQILANSLNTILSAPVQGQDLDGIGEIAKAIWAQPDVSFVKVFDAEGNQLVGPGEDQFPSGVVDRSVMRAVADLHPDQRWTDDGLEVISPVTSGARLIGAVQFGFNTARIDDEIRALTINRIWQTVALVVAGVAVSYIVASYITEPIRKLLRVTERLAGGNLEARVERLHGRELRELGTSFNLMAGELEEKVQALQESRSRIVTAQEGVRRDLAVHLHGPVQGRLLALKAQLEQLASEEGAGEGTTSNLHRIAEDMGQVIREEISSLSRQLYPAIVRRGVVPSLQSLGDQYDASLEVVVDLDEQLISRERVNPDLVPEATRLAIYRIAEEAMNNIAKHAKARAVTLGLSVAEGYLNLAIHDNGSGFDSKFESQGMGLSAMLDYAEAAGGTCGVESAPGEGTTVFAALPYALPNDESAEQTIK
jgi:signal transduction histidine kinase